MTLISSQKSYTKTPQRTQKPDDSEVWEGIAGITKISPASKGIRYHFKSEFSVTYPQEFFFAMHVGSPTIGITVAVVPPDGFEVKASPVSTSTDNLWKYDRLFMPGEHVDIRWQKKSKTDNSN